MIFCINILGQSLIDSNNCCCSFFLLNLTLVHRCGAGADGGMRVCHATGLGLIPCRDRFPEWSFIGVFLTCKTNVSPPHLAIIIMLLISTLLEWMCEWMVCIVFNVRVISEVAPALSGSLIWGGPPWFCLVKKYVCDPQIIHSPDRSWLCKALEAWVT